MINQSTAMLYHSAATASPQRQLSQYRWAVRQGRYGQLWSMLAGRSRCLLDLAIVRANCFVHACCDAGLRTVPIDQIRGSEGRASDFDRDFNPLQERTRERWVSIATARERGRTLPPIDLVQVGDTYFVRDGHHRISVARALGEQAIEARVVIWQVTGPMPWMLPRPPQRVFSSKLAAIVRALHKAWSPARIKTRKALLRPAGPEAVSEPVG